MGRFYQPKLEVGLKPPQTDGGVVWYKKSKVHGSHQCGLLENKRIMILTRVSHAYIHKTTRMVSHSLE